MSDWKLPEHLEPYRSLISSFLLDDPSIVGRESLTIEEIVNNQEWKRNPILSVDSISDQILLLQRLYEANKLK